LNEARAFCEWLSKKEQSEGLLRPQHRYRLPTDLEWSRIAGLPIEEGSTPAIRDTHPMPDHYPWGNQWPPPPNSGNFADMTSARLQNNRIIEGYEDGFPKTSPVGRFFPNQFGLFDLAGNIWEWVDEGYLGKDSKLFVIRGGGWDSFRSENLLSSYRNAVPPDLREGAYGFRILLSNEDPGNTGEP
jgi:formylglycine-generating enzyme required for sulfatase activity